MKVLFVCLMGRFRSKTANDMWDGADGLEVDYCGAAADADVPCTQAKLDSADKVYVMDGHVLSVLSRKYTGFRDKSVCLLIPDQYDYMEDRLVDILDCRLSGVLGQPKRVRP